MKAKLLINGKELEVEISEEELKKLEEKQRKKTGYERVDDNHVCYYEVDGDVASDYDIHGDGEMDNIYKVANYYSDETVAENNVCADKLMRQLRRFAVEHREEQLDWKDYDQNKYYIFYDHVDDEMRIESDTSARDIFQIYFDSFATAQRTINTFHDELIWYFTEYKDSL